MITVSFQYQHKQRKLQHEALCSKIVQRVGAVISLPQFVEVFFYDLPNNVHGGVDARPNRVVLSNALTIHDLPMILIHELIHVNQKHSGKLQVNPDGMHLWEGKLFSAQQPEKLSNQQYQALPWEADVQSRIHHVVKQALS